MSDKKYSKKCRLFTCTILALLIIAVSCSPTINIYPQGKPETKPEDNEIPTVVVPTAIQPESMPTQEPKPTEVPPTAVPPTPVPPTPIPPTPVPTVSLGVVDIGNGFWLTYDTDLWKVNNVHGFNILQSRTYNGCDFNYQSGHGMDMNTFGANTFSKTLGGINFDVTRWTRISNGDLVILAFYYGSEYFSVENRNAATLSAECEAQAYDVVALSAEKGFMP